MKKLMVLMLCMGCSALALAQNTQTDDKPSAAIPVLKSRKARSATETASPALKAPPTPSRHAAAEPPELPVGTAVKMKLETPLSTGYNMAGDRFSGRVTEPVMLAGRTMIPVGASLEGRVVKVSEPRRIRGTPTIDLRPDTVILPNGERYRLDAVVVDTSARPETDVNDEGKIKGRGHDTNDLRLLGVGAGGGAVLGAVAGGGEGALIGTGVGTTAAVVRWLVKRRTAALPTGTEIVMELSRPMTLSPASPGL